MLEAAGATLDDVVKMAVYLKNVEDLQDARDLQATIHERVSGEDDGYVRLCRPGVPRDDRAACPWSKQAFGSSDTSCGKDTSGSSLVQMLPKEKLKKSPNRWMNWPGAPPSAG